MVPAARRLYGLYAVTASRLQPAGQLPGRVEAALRGGARAIQYRDKGRNDAGRRPEAEVLRALCHRYGALFIVNDDISLALAVGADGVHLGEHDVGVAEARRQLGEHILIGASCYANPALADAAIDAGADYVAFGSVFPSTVKPEAPAVPLCLLAQQCRRLPVPVVAIGGIDASNAAAVIDCGVAAVAVIHGVFGGEDVAARARVIAAAFPH